MKYGAVREQLREAGIVMSKRGDTIRINFFGGLENTARYTESLEEALKIGLAMKGRPTSGASLNG